MSLCENAFRIAVKSVIFWDRTSTVHPILHSNFKYTQIQFILYAQAILFIAAIVCGSKTNVKCSVYTTAYYSYIDEKEQGRVVLPVPVVQCTECDRVRVNM